MNDKLLYLIKSQGWRISSDMVGGFDTLCRLLNIETPMDFLHLFDDLEQVKSDSNEDWILFNKSNYNFMIYDTKDKEVYINYYEIWLCLSSNFELNYQEIQLLTEEWLDKVYNLRGVTTGAKHNDYS